MADDIRDDLPEEEDDLELPELDDTDEAESKEPIAQPEKQEPDLPLPDEAESKEPIAQPEKQEPDLPLPGDGAAGFDLGFRKDPLPEPIPAEGYETIENFTPAQPEPFDSSPPPMGLGSPIGGEQETGTGSGTGDDVAQQIQALSAQISAQTAMLQQITGVLQNLAGRPKTSTFS